MERPLGRRAFPGGGSTARGPRVRRGRLFRLTRQGKAFLGVTLALGLAAINTGNNLLYLVLGLMLSLLLLSGVMSDLVLWSVRVERVLPRRLFVGAPTLIEIALRNGKRWLPSYSLEVSDRLDDGPTPRPVYFLKVAPGEVARLAYRHTPGRRGSVTHEGFFVLTRYPFGLIEKGRVIDRAEVALVYPELLVAPPALPESRAAGSEVPLRGAGSGTEVAGLRAYRAGDEARAIHWRRTASMGQLVVRERESEQARRICLLLDNALPPAPGGEPGAFDPAYLAGLEVAIREAASVATEAVAEGAAVEVVTRGEASPLIGPGASLDPLYRFLALLEPRALLGAPPFAARAGLGRRVEVRPVASPVGEEPARAGGAA